MLTNYPLAGYYSPLILHLFFLLPLPLLHPLWLVFPHYPGHPQ
jgi:hypothetical protein